METEDNMGALDIALGGINEDDIEINEEEAERELNVSLSEFYYIVFVIYKQKLTLTY